MRETLEALGAPKAAIDTEVNQLLEVTIAKTASRGVLGSMNDFQFMVRHIRNQRPNASLLDLGLELADTPCSPIDGWPTDVRATAASRSTTRALGSRPQQDEPDLISAEIRKFRPIALPPIESK